MTTDTTLEFRNNQDMFNPEQIQPANVNVFDAKNLFNQASMAHEIKPSEPQQDVMLDSDKVRLMNTVMAPNESLNNNIPEGIKMPAKGEINELSKGVAGVAMEAGMALFDSFRDKSQDGGPAPEDLERKLAMNMQPRPPAMGMGIGGGPGG